MSEVSTQVMPPDEIQRATTDFINTSPMFKKQTAYLRIGDEPTGGDGTIDLATLLKPDDVALLKQYLTYMPRSLLYGFFMDKIWPGIPLSGSLGPVTENQWYVNPFYGGAGHLKKGFEDMVWMGFIDFFNVANLEYVNSNQLDPWDWESQKITAYYTSQDKAAMAQLESQFAGYADAMLSLDPIALKILAQFITLPKLGDLGMEINRQNALKELLKKKDYVTAQAIVDAFYYAQNSIIGEAVTNPIPYDIINKDGSVMARKS